MSRTVSPDVEYSSDYGQDWWSGYIPENENLEELERTAVEYAYASIPRGNEVPEVFTIADWWDMENQGRVGRCAGMAAASAGEIEHFKLTVQKSSSTVTSPTSSDRTEHRGVVATTGLRSSLLSSPPRKMVTARWISTKTAGLIIRCQTGTRQASLPSPKKRRSPTRWGFTPFFVHGMKSSPSFKLREQSLSAVHGVTGVRTHQDSVIHSRLVVVVTPGQFQAGTSRGASIASQSLRA